VDSKYRSLMLIEGPVSAIGPDVHPHSVEGALVSIAPGTAHAVLRTNSVSGTLQVRAPRVNDRRVDAEGQRQRSPARFFPATGAARRR
jgi:hypothetical protein